MKFSGYPSDDVVTMQQFKKHLDSIDERRIERQIAALRHKLGAARSLRKRERYAKRIQSKKAQLLVAVICRER